MAQTTLARLVRKSADKKENNQIMNSVSQIAIAGFWRKKRESRTQNDVVIILVMPYRVVQTNCWVKRIKVETPGDPDAQYALDVVQSGNLLTIALVGGDTYIEIRLTPQGL